jgi:ribosome-associated protein
MHEVTKFKAVIIPCMKPKKTNSPVDAAIEADATDDLLPSKTQLKAEADAQQALGVRLSELPKDKLLKLNLPEALLEAVLESKRITANGAIRRHRQYLGRLMREIDTAPISEQLARWDGKHTAENAYFHGLERWRDRLIKDPNAVSEFLDLHPQTDSQQLRTLIRNANKELAANKPPKSSRELFKLLRSIMDDENQQTDSDISIDEDADEQSS